MFVAELTEALRLLLTQFLLQNLKFGVIEGQYILAPASAFWLFGASAVFEWRKMYDDGAFLIIWQNPLPFALAGFLGLGINFLSYYVIQATSSLTMKVLGTLRNILTIGMGIVFYGETVSMTEGLGYSLALLGFVCYNASKSPGAIEQLTNSRPWLHYICFGSLPVKGKVESADDNPDLSV